MATVESILSDLNVDKIKILESVKTLGLEDTARVLGFDTLNPDNTLAAGRLLMLNLRRFCPGTISEYVAALGHRFQPDFKAYLLEHQKVLDHEIQKHLNNDFLHDFFSASTLIKTYLARPLLSSQVSETPQFLYMRVAVQLYMRVGLDLVLQAFREMSSMQYTHASPTLLNAGMKDGTLSSCFLLSAGDSLESILGTVRDAGIISKAKGGLGIDISRVRHSEIGASGSSRGIVPMLQVFNSLVRYVDQTGVRKGAGTFFARTHHIDAYEFVQLVDKQGDKYAQAHDINICFWASWLFFERARRGEKWTLFCPAKTPSLNDIYGKQFEAEYVRLEVLAEERERHYQNAVKLSEELNDKMRRALTDVEVSGLHAQIREANANLLKAQKARITHKVVNAADLLQTMTRMQMRAGMPFICSGDSANMKSNQKHVGPIRSSNLCLEIMEVSDDETISSCNLASLSLRHFALSPLRSIDELSKAYDFAALGRATRSVVRNLNRVIDENIYPLDDPKGGYKISKTNRRDRPIGLGVSGLAEALAILDLPFVDPNNLSSIHPMTDMVNKAIFACIYFNALAESLNLAMVHGPYDTFAGSPLSQGKLQFDLWREEFEVLGPNPFRKESDDNALDPKIWGQEAMVIGQELLTPSWDVLKSLIVKYGTRNSLLTALMPTATTAQVLRNCETTEAHMSNIYSRKVMNGAYPVMHRFLVSDLQEIGLWNEQVFQFIQASNGSIQKLPDFLASQGVELGPKTSQRLSWLCVKYRTMWEISQKVMLRMAADRGRYVDQSQSLNVYIPTPTLEQLQAVIMMGHQLGLKTLVYYLRQNPVVDPIKFTVDPEIQNAVRRMTKTSVDADTSGKRSRIECSGDVCLMCQ